MSERLVVDCAWFTSCYPNNYLVKINDEYYLKHYRGNGLRKVNKQWARNVDKSEFPDYMYITSEMEKKIGYTVELDRAITPEELEELKERFSLDEDKITEPFQEVKGAIYGEAYKKVFTAIQVFVGSSHAINLESELMAKGIEAGNYSPGIVSIRIR